jgi:hypothetical protein
MGKCVNGAASATLCRTSQARPGWPASRTFDRGAYTYNFPDQLGSEFESHRLQAGNASCSFTKDITDKPSCFSESAGNRYQGVLVTSLSLSDEIRYSHHPLAIELCASSADAGDDVGNHACGLGVGTRMRGLNNFCNSAGNFYLTAFPIDFRTNHRLIDVHKHS